MRLLLLVVAVAVSSQSWGQGDNAEITPLTHLQVEDMESHPDPVLLDNLQQKRFSAISDTRWSRWNQYTVLFEYFGYECLNDNFTGTLGAEDKKTLSDALLVSMGNQLISSLVSPATMSWPYGASYFLKNRVGDMDHMIVHIFQDCLRT